MLELAQSSVSMNGMREELDATPFHTTWETGTAS
jgi:hypothetical protein